MEDQSILINLLTAHESADIEKYKPHINVGKPIIELTAKEMREIWPFIYISAHKDGVVKGHIVSFVWEELAERSITNHYHIW